MSDTAQTPPAAPKPQIERLGDRLSYICNVAAAIGLIAITVVNGINVSARYFFDFAFPWAEELMQFIMIAMIFAGCVTITWRQLHIRIDLLLEAFSPKLRRLVNGAVALVSIAAILYIDQASFSIVQKLYQFEQASLALEIPLWIPQIFVAGGLLMMAVLIFVRTVLSFLRSPSADQGHI